MSHAPREVSPAGESKGDKNLAKDLKHAPGAVHEAMDAMKAGQFPSARTDAPGIPAMQHDQAAAATANAQEAHEAKTVADRSVQQKLAQTDWTNLKAQLQYRDDKGAGLERAIKLGQAGEASTAVAKQVSYMQDLVDKIDKHQAQA